MAPTDFAEYDANVFGLLRLENEGITTSINDAGGYGPNGFRLIMNQALSRLVTILFFKINPGITMILKMTGGFELPDETSLNFDLFVDGPATNFATAEPTSCLVSTAALRQQNFTLPT